MTQLYSVKESKTDYLVMKFDRDMNHEHTYSVSKSGRECDGEFCAHRPNCKHRKILAFFRQAGHIGDGYAIDWDTRVWHRPAGDMLATLREAAELEAAKAGRQMIYGEWDTPNVPEGVTVVGLDDPAALHETIAEAVGESASEASLETPDSNTIEADEDGLEKEAFNEEDDPNIISESTGPASPPVPPAPAPTTSSASEGSGGGFLGGRKFT